METGKRKTEVQHRVIHIFGAVRLSLLLLVVMHTHLYVWIVFCSANSGRSSLSTLPYGREAPSFNMIRKAVTYSNSRTVR